MKGTLDLRKKKFEDIKIIILDRHNRHINELDIEYDKLSKDMKEFALVNFRSGFIDCIQWLKERGVIKVKISDKL